MWMVIFGSPFGPIHCIDQIAALLVLDGGQTGEDVRITSRSEHLVSLVEEVVLLARLPLRRFAGQNVTKTLEAKD